MPSQIYRSAGRCLDLKNTLVYYCPVGFKIRNLKFLIIGTPSRTQQSIVCQDREKNLAQSFFFCKMVGIDITVQTNSGPIEGLHSKSSTGKGLLFLWVKKGVFRGVLVCIQLKMNWVLRSNPEDQINRKPEDQVTTRPKNKIV